MTEAQRIAIQALEKVLTDLEAQTDELLQRVANGRAGSREVTAELASHVAFVDLHRDAAALSGYEPHWRALQAALSSNLDDDAATYLRVVHVRARSTLVAIRRSR